nr:organic hydroperoxide resistance protein [bacterium]
MKIFYKTSATATAISGRDGHIQVDDGSIGFDLVSFQNDGTGADEKHQRAEYSKHRRTDEKRPHGVGEKLLHGLA